MGPILYFLCVKAHFRKDRSENPRTPCRPPRNPQVKTSPGPWGTEVVPFAAFPKTPRPTSQVGGKMVGFSGKRWRKNDLGSIFSDINMIYHIVDGFNQLILLVFIFCEIWGWTWTWRIGHAFEKIWVEALPAQKLVFNSQELYSVWPTEMGLHPQNMVVC